MAAIVTTNGTAAVETCPCGACKSRRDTVAKKVAATIRVDELRERGWRVDLPDGNHAVMRDPKTVTNGQRRTFKEAGVSVGLLNQQIETAMATGNVAMVEALTTSQARLGANFDVHKVSMFVQTWSYDAPVPQPNDSGSLDGIPGPCFDRLHQVADDLLAAAFLDDEVTAMDVDSPFPASSDSSTPS